MSKQKQILTLDDLVAFCKKQKIYKFDANEFGKQICVRVDNIASFEQEDNDSKDGFMHLLFKVCHAGENRNMSNISKDNLDKYKSTINYRPVLASIVTSPDDASVLDFNSHDIELDDNGNVIYIEKQVGCFTADEPFLKYDEENDKTYLMAHAVIPEEYTATADIIRRKGGTKVSCEIGIDNMSYDEDTGILDIIDFSFLGVCLLGDHVTEGMAGSRADVESIADFSAENNSLTVNVDAKFSDSLIELLEKLDKKLDSLSKFNDITNDSSKEGGEDKMDKFNELLELYGLTEEEIEFEHEGLSDEELETAFNEAFGDAEEFKKKKKKCSEEDSDNDEGKDFAGCGKKKKKRCSINTEDNTIEFELSFDEIRMALYSLINGDIHSDSYSWICEVYDSNFVYQTESWIDDTYDCKYYKQNYSKDGDNVSLSGDAIEVFSTFVTESEKTALEMMRTQYEELKAFKDEYDAEVLRAQKDEILNDEKYSVLEGNEKFEQLKKDAEKFSVEEVQTQAKLIFADYVIEAGNYSATGEHTEKKTKKIGLNFGEKPKKKTAYGGLFDND